MNLNVVLRRLVALTVAVLSASASIVIITAGPAQATEDFVDFPTSPIAYTRPVVTAQTAACSALTGRKISTASITAAKLEPATSALPAYCDVQGVTPPSVHFDIALPIKWNARLYSTGDFGCGGQIASTLAQRNIAVGYNFAAVTTDAGIDNHNETCSWAAGEPNLAIEFAYAGIHAATVVTKSIIAVFYARTPIASYFESCSTGGHDALEEAQRYPDDFNGIVAGSPVLGAGTLMSMAWTSTTFASLPAAQAMTPAKISYIASAVSAKCDKLDGLVDGLIANPQACVAAFIPSRDLTVCKTGTNANNCLTAAQLAAYERVLGPVMSGTTPIYPGLALGAETEYNISNIPPPGAPLSSMLDYFLAGTYMQYLFPWPQTEPQEYNINTFDYKTGPARIASFRAMFNATSLNMNAFFERGGKLLIYTGLADPVTSPYGAIAYYDDLSRQYGTALRSSALLYTVPGMWHCLGGRGPDHFDPMTKLVDWVEGKLQPNTILARRVDTAGAIEYTRTLCPYPEIGYYRSGNKNLASSFACVEGTVGVPGAGTGDDLQLP